MIINTDAIKLPEGFFEKVDNVPKFYDWLNSLPTIDAVEVVRCKDCAYRDGSACEWADFWLKDDDYCSRAERRTDEGAKMADLIERKPLYERAARLEAEALDEASKLIERERVGEVTSEDWRIWSAVLAERTAFKHDVIDAPSAQPEIIRCKDCKHRYGKACDFADFWVKDDDYCSRAERRTDG